MHWNDTDFHSTLLTRYEWNNGLNGVLLYLNSLYTGSTMEVLMLLFCFLIHLFFFPLLFFFSILPLFFFSFFFFYRVDLTTNTTYAFPCAKCWEAASSISIQSQMCWNGSWGSDNPINARKHSTKESWSGVFCGNFKLSKPNFYSVEVLLLL